MFAVRHGVAAGPAAGADNLHNYLSGRYGVRAARRAASGIAAAAHRLMPLTPEDAFDRQPLASARHLLAGDFRLNDRPELIADLGLDPRQAERLADSDLVLAAWERWGDAAPDHLAGEFAFVVHDLEERATYAVVDHLGARALYYVQTGDGAIIASGLPAILAMPGVDRTPDPRVLARLLIDDPFADDLTPYKAIRRILAGTMVRFGPDGEAKTRRYWDLDTARSIRLGGDHDYVDRARELLDRAVLNNARLDGAVAATLTAGLDSSAIVGTLAKRRPELDVCAMTLAPPEDAETLAGMESDESAYAARHAAHWPCVRHEILRTPERMAHHWETPGDWFASGGYPRRNVRELEWFDVLFDAAREGGAKGVFVGEGGNLGLTYPGVRALPYWLVQGRFLKVAREMRAMSRQPGGDWPGWPKALWRDLARPLAPAWLRRGLDRWQGLGIWPPMLRRAAVAPAYFRDSRIGEEMAENGIGTYREFPLDAPDYRYRWFWSFSARRADAYEATRARTGVTLLHPLLDRRLIEFCLAIPDEQYLRDGQQRYLARRVLADRLAPQAFDPLPKFYQGGDRGAVLTAHRDIYRGVLEDVAQSPVAQEVLDIPRLRRLLDNWPEPGEWTARGLDPAYGAAIPRALHMGQFIRWTEGANR